MKRLMILAAFILVVALGSYAMFAGQPSGPDDMMGGGTGGMGCSGCAAKHVAVAATSDGGAIVAAAGKLIRYDATLTKVNEVDIDVDWDAANQKGQQGCPMMQMMH